MKLNKMQVLGILIILAWLPVSLPLLAIGALARLVSASVLWGWSTTDDLLYEIARSFVKKKRNG